ncbi:hypothetical protein TRSC58_03703 [Trypanosoma rangeli SC58]|uniref:Uncharacterized protein n=1 Tax=Trypanosoma rangeli SC58 TaxID=429131 RepID=A0A061J3D7_TRYRA|nr:hypothetical protein TRSC58_03703 [Trypanosoma rangeli SC58]
MPENQPPQRFLTTTRSQHLHREESMRRRLELMRRESTKPPVMHFGITTSLPRSNIKSGKSISPPPQFVHPDAGAVKKSSRSAPMVHSEPRSRPLSRERSHRLPLPPGAKPTTRRPPFPRSMSYRGVSATASRVTSPVPAAQREEIHSAHPPRKRSRSSSQSRKGAKLARVSHPQTNDATMEERRAPFMCSGSPLKRIVSPLRRSASRTPPPMPFLTTRTEVNGNTMLCFTPPMVQLDKTEEVAFSISPVAPPQTEIFEDGKVGEVPSMEAAEEEEPIPFRVSEFRLPRTPQHRTSDTAIHIVLTPPHVLHFSHPAEGEDPRATEDEVENDKASTNARGCSAESEVVSAVSCRDEMPMSHHSLEEETILGSSSATPVASNMRGNEEEEEEQKMKEEMRRQSCENVATATASDLGVSTQEENTQLAPYAVAALVLINVDVAVAKEPAALSAQSSYACECSSTTTESPERNLEASEVCKLTFDSYDVSQREEKKAVSLERLTAEEVVPPVLPLHPESEAFSQPFYACISAPSTPEMELPEAYRLLEATRQEMAVPSSFSRAPRRRDDSRGEEGRGSLVLVTGELPLVHTPRIQEPHTPPPSEQPKRYSPLPKHQLSVLDAHGVMTSSRTNDTALLSFDRSPLPRPMTILSQVRTPMPSSQTKVYVTLSQSPSEDGSKLSTLMPQAGIFNFNEGGAEDEPQCEKRCPVDERALEATPPWPSARCRSRSTGSRKSMVEQLMECCSPDARKEVEHLVATEATTQTPSLHRGSRQLSEALTDTSSISQRVAARPRRHYYDYTYWERYLREATRQSAKKEREKGAKKAKRAAKKTAAWAVAVESEGHVKRQGFSDQEVVSPLAESTLDAKSTVTAALQRTTEAVQGKAAWRPSQLQSGHTTKTSAKRASLKKTMSRKNREQISRRRRRLSGKQNRRK